MHRTEDVELKFTGLSARPQTYRLPLPIAQEVEQYIRQQIENSGQDASVPAAEVLPELADDASRAAAVLRGLRHRENLTQKALADKIGIRQHHLSEMENGKRPIGKEMAKKLAKVLRTDWKMLV